MDPREPKIILERFYSRNVLLKAIKLVVVGCIGSIVAMPDLIVPLLSFHGFLRFLLQLDGVIGRPLESDFF